jgi:prepilin-type N-terminal cleavage/methylation domain-containing protein
MAPGMKASRHPEWAIGQGIRHQPKRSFDFCSKPLARAYTLIELLMVITILGIAATLLIPNMIGPGSMSAQAAARLLIADLSFAQSDALAHQEYRRVHFYADGTGYCIVRVAEADFADDFDPDTADYVHDPLGSAGQFSPYIVDFSTDDRFKGVSISEVVIDDDARDISYDALGGTVMEGGGGIAPGIGGAITITSSQESYRIDVAPFTGKLTVTKL